MSRDQRDHLLLRVAAPQASLTRELVTFLLNTKKWWLTPIVVSILILGLFVFLSGTAAAPFIYTLF